MYSLGVLLAGLSSWVLLRALRSDTNRSLWWSLYGVVLALFCYTHDFAFFTIVAQMCILTAITVRYGWEQAWRKAVRFARWPLYAGAVTAILYSPWLPVLVSQIGDARHGAWIPPATAAKAGQILAVWLTGVPSPSIGASGAVLLVAACAMFVLWRRDRAALFFLSQAAVPLVLVLLLSFLAGRSLLVDRYLAFAHFFLLAFWGVLLTPLATPIRLVTAGILLSLCTWGVTKELAQIRPEPHPITQAAAFLGQNYAEGDLVQVAGPSALNRLRFYTFAIRNDIRIQCTVNLDSTLGHIHSLKGDEVVRNGEADQQFQRIWICGSGHGPPSSPPPGMVFVFDRSFRTVDVAYTVALYQRQR